MELCKQKHRNQAFRDEHVMDGVMCGIDAIGFAGLAELVNPTGRSAVVGDSRRRAPIQRNRKTS